MIDPSPYIARLDEVLAQFDDLEYLLERKHQPTIREDDDVRTLLIRFISLLETVAPPGSPHRRAVDDLDPSNSDHYQLRVCASAGRALRSDLSSGSLRSVEELAHASMFEDLLGQADELLESSFKDAAAVIAGCALETHLTALCELHGEDSRKPDGRRVKADTMRTNLQSKEIYSLSESKQLLVWLGIRNDAAHGDHDKYQEAEVRMMIDGIGAFISRNPA